MIIAQSTVYRCGTPCPGPKRSCIITVLCAWPEVIVQSGCVSGLGMDNWPIGRYSESGFYC